MKFSGLVLLLMGNLLTARVAWGVEETLKSGSIFRDDKSGFEVSLKEDCGYSRDANDTYQSVRHAFSAQDKHGEDSARRSVSLTVQETPPWGCVPHDGISDWKEAPMKLIGGNPFRRYNGYNVGAGQRWKQIWYMGEVDGKCFRFEMMTFTSFDEPPFFTKFTSGFRFLERSSGLQHNQSPKPTNPAQGGR